MINETFSSIINIEIHIEEIGFIMFLRPDSLTVDCIFREYITLDTDTSN